MAVTLLSHRAGKAPALVRRAVTLAVAALTVLGGMSPLRAAPQSRQKPTENSPAAAEAEGKELIPRFRQIRGPEIGIIDFYGLRTVSEETVRKVLGVAEGGPLPRSKHDTELAIEEIPGVVFARLQAVCCHDSRAILYVGIEERGAPHFDYRPPPQEPLFLPEEIHRTYALFLSALNEAVRKNEIDEDFTQGHSLISNARARSYQEKFLAQAEKHLDRLRAVLRRSADAEHRAIAAYVIGYAPDKKAVIDDLLYALRDPDDTVRSNAMRALVAIEVYSRRNPQLEIRIPPTWLIEMLNSIIWTDRTSAAVNLVNLTEERDQETLDRIRDRALSALLDMARWKHLPHALPAYILLGRILGLEEKEIQEYWAGENRLELVKRAAELEASAGKKKRRKEE